MDTVLEKQKNFILKVIPGERFTPFSLTKKLNATVLLESASFDRGRERFSILIVDRAFSVYEVDNEIYMEMDGKRFRLKRRGRDILDVISYFAKQHISTGINPDLPFPAGGIGYLGYEYASKFDKIKLKNKVDPLGIPDACFIFGHIFLIFDHYTDTISLLGVNYREHSIDLERRVGEIEERMNDLDFNFMTQKLDRYEARDLTPPDDRENFLEGVSRIKEEIVKGNLLQAVLSRRLRVESKIPALEAYRNLRVSNPSPYMFYLDFDSFQIFGSSPEVHVKKRGNNVIMRPIAGTRRRGKTHAEDMALEKELLANEKEAAEHLMLVDLARNDLGRVCEAGSVTVTESRVIERYSHVMHIVSQVEGKLMESKSGLDVIRATFPAGTVSGAPKIRAIETVDSLERERRGFYAGIVGYLEPDGNLDTCITIRSALKKDDLLILQAGAGIVYDSVAEQEFRETQAKLNALISAIGMEV